MTRDELLRLLNLSGKSPPPEEEPLGITGDDTAPPAPTSEQALVLDLWDLDTGRRIRKESGRLKAYGTTDEETSDFHGMSFLPEPEFTERCVDPLREQFLKELADTPKWQGVRASSVLNPLVAEVATVAVAEQYKELKEKMQPRPPGSKPVNRDVACAVAATSAAAGAATDVERVEGQQASFGMGPGSPGCNDVKAIAALFQRIRNSPTLQRICELAGKLRPLAYGKQRQKVRHGTDDLVGVKAGDDVERMLAQEVALLVMPQTRMEGLRRFAEKESMCLDRRSVERVGQGPIILTCDSSGSMHGEKIYSAKAVALSLAMIARKQKRWCALIDYSGSTGELLCALPPGRWDENALADWLENAFGAGSDLDVPVRELPDYYTRLNAPRGKTDVVMITDAICRIPEQIRDRFNAWKKSVQARVISLVINSAPGDLAGVSDEVYRVASLSPDEEAVGRVLSI